eukprot:g4571.t1
MVFGIAAMRRTTTLLPLLLALVHAGPTDGRITPSAYAASFRCATDIDCQLNGMCANGTCKCDDAWGGEDCGDLQLEPGTVAYGCLPEGLDHGAPPDCDFTSWGGGPPVYDASRQKWVLFVSEMAGHCGLSVWQHMSTIVRATADHPAGPYVRDALVVGAESHNAYYVQDPVSQLHLIYHIGTGDRTNQTATPWQGNCSNGTTPHVIEIPTAASQPAPLRAGPIGPAGADFSPEIHASPSLHGPFTRVQIRGVPVGLEPRGASNPAPYIFPNGTALVLFRLYNASVPEGVHPTSRIFAMRAPSFKGPYAVLAELFHPSGFPLFNSSGETHVNDEDPVLYRDARGHFHNLNHFTHGHGFSEDGITWHWADPKARGRTAWTSSLQLSNGSVVVLRDSERPRVWINASTGQPELLFVSTGGQKQPTAADGIARGFTMVQRIRAS